MRPTFDRDYIANEFHRIASELSEPLAVHLIGGGAMALRDLKAATKDIDLVVADSDAYRQLWAALMELGFTQVRSPGTDYQALGATSWVENDDGCRFDLFNRQVANTLVLSEGVRARSEAYMSTGPLTVRLVSNEDLFLFKLVAARGEDIDDMNILVQTALDFAIVRAELDAQIEDLGDDRFVTYANEALIELEERHGVTTPADGYVQELTDRYYLGLENLQILDGPMTVEDLAGKLEADVRDIRERIAYLATFDRVRCVDQTVHPVDQG